MADPLVDAQGFWPSSFGDFSPEQSYRCLARRFMRLQADVVLLAADRRHATCLPAGRCVRPPDLEAVIEW
jgi:hypothetical protein